MEALARRYLSPMLCARMHPYEGHIEHLIMAEDFDIGGMIFEALKCCDIYGDEYPLLREWLKEKCWNEVCGMIVAGVDIGSLRSKPSY
ncbi:MAG: 2-hydroxyacyl-CoA dehydratase family protein [Candidatus Alkanophagales archaeon]